MFGASLTTGATLIRTVATAISMAGMSAVGNSLSINVTYPVL